MHAIFDTHDIRSADPSRFLRKRERVNIRVIGGLQSRASRPKSANIRKTMESGRTVAEILQSPSDLSARAYKRAIVGRDARRNREGKRDARGKRGVGRRTRGILCNGMEHLHERPSDTNQLEAIKNPKG